MFLKLTTHDIFNTTLVDSVTGEAVFNISTPSDSAPPSPSSTRSRASSIASWSRLHWGRSCEKLPIQELEPEPRTTIVEDRHGFAVAEIVWEGRHASQVRIGDETLRGTAEMFDASFVKVLPDYTLLPTRMEYTWSISPEDLTLLDDDQAVVGRLHVDCALACGRVVATPPGTGHDCLQFADLPPDDLVEIIVSYVLVASLRKRLYSVTKYVYGAGRPPARRPLVALRKHATRSLANLRESLRRTISSALPSPR